MEDEEEDEEDDEEEDRLLDSIVEEIDAEVAEDSRSAATSRQTQQVEKYLGAALDTACCRNDCFSQFNQPKLDQALREMSQLSQHERCKMLYSVVAFSYAERERRGQGSAAEQTDAGAEEAGAVADVYRRRSYAYVLLGTRVCRNCVCRLHGVSTKALVAAQDGVGRGHLAPPTTKHGQHRKGARFDRTKAVIEFFEQLSITDGYPDPCGRGSERNKAVTYLPAQWTKPRTAAKRFSRLTMPRRCCCRCSLTRPSACSTWWV